MPCVQSPCHGPELQQLWQRKRTGETPAERLGGHGQAIVLTTMHTWLRADPLQCGLVWA